ADGAQSSRVPVPLLEDPYEVITQAYLVEADTESEPFEDLVDTKTPESPHTIASPTSLPDSTPPTCHVEESEDSDTSGARSMSSDSTAPLSPDHPLTHTTPALVPILHRTARIAVHVPPVMSPSFSASIAEVAATSDSTFRKRFRSSYESSPSSSPSDLPLRKRYLGTSELVEDEEEEEEDDEEEDDDEEEEEIEERSDSDSESEDAEDEGPTAEDEDPALGDKGLVVGDEGPGMRVESLGLGGDESVPEGQQRVGSVVKTAMGEPLGLGYGELRCREIALGEGRMPSVFEVGENVVEISSDKIEVSGDWDSPEYQDTANSGGKKETKAMIFHKMDTEEIIDRFMAPCFVNGLEAYDGEINFGVEENIISNEYAVKLCLEHEVKRGNKIVKKELIVSLRVEIYFVKFIINPEEDDVEPGVIFRRSFLRMTKAITDFRAGTITIYPDIDLFLEDTEEEEKSMDDWDKLLDFNLDNIPLLGGEELSPFV
ncbi:hypothetical protein Tco_1132504, partial [Tanacetum coccineum]